MKQLLTTGIILSRTDYGEADRIITLLTSDYGKLRLMAKGVRKVKSKLAGGIELFSVSNITFLQGRNDVGTLISTRLIKHYGRIVQDIERTMLGYELIKQLNKGTEDEPEAEYFQLLEHTFEALDQTNISTDLIRAWFTAQLLKLAGHSPNLQTDTAGSKLEVGKTYNFSFDDMAFVASNAGKFNADNIKFLRLLFSSNVPAAIQRVSGWETYTKRCLPLVQTQKQLHLH